MAHVAVTLMWLDLLLIAVATWHGVDFWLGDGGDDALRRHILFTLLATLLNCFIHCLAMFYFIGTGKDIKEAIRPYPEMDQIYRPRVRRFNGLVSAYATFGILLIIAAAGATAAAQTGYLPPWTQVVVAAVAIAFTLYAFWIEFTTIRKNRGIIRTVNRYLIEKKKEVVRKQSSSQP